jgi:hypothetical protein
MTIEQATVTPERNSAFDIPDSLFDIPSHATGL